MSNNLPSNNKDTACKLSEVEPNSPCTVLNVAQKCNASDRLADMGFTAGAKVRVLRFAPLGDPLEVEIRGYRLCLRKETAENIVVSKI